MNILLDYDVPSTVKDSKEKYSILKITRNRGKIWMKFSFPGMFIMDLILFKSEVFRLYPNSVLWFLFFESISELLDYKFVGDRYKKRADIKLLKLVSQLRDMNIDTNLNLLNESECYYKTYNIRLNEKKIPQLIESKYITVPSFDYNGDEINTSLLQEHVVCSNSYILSIGSPKKAYKLAYSMR